MMMIQYRGKTSEDFARALHKINAPCRVVMTLRKLKTVLPSLKPSVDKMLKSGVVYQISCSRCNACYVGQTDRHFQTRFKEHLSRHPMKTHLTECRAETEQNILGTYTKIYWVPRKGVPNFHLFTLVLLSYPLSRNPVYFCVVTQYILYSFPV